MKKMKVLATVLLLGALIGAIVSWPFRQSFWGGLALSTFEAALVGALADWFAIVAIFRHPLGIRFIPHTAIIPNNRERIINSIADIVENQWLSLDIIKSKISDYPIIDKMSVVLESSAGKEKLESIVLSLIVNTIKDIEPDYAAKFIQQVIKENFSEISVSEDMVEKFEGSLKELYGDDIIDFLIDKLSAMTEDYSFIKVVKNTMHKAANDYAMRGGFFRRLGKGLGEGLDVINYEEAAESISKKFADFLEDIKEPYNPYRAKIKESIRTIKFTNQESASAMLGSLVQKTISTDDGFNAVVDLVSVLKAQLITENIERSPLVKYFAVMISEQVQNLKANEIKKVEFEGWIKKACIDIVERYHGVVGNLVTENLQSLNDQSFVDSLEDKVGEDLQWIRVNGTVIGALVGIVEYLILHIL
ncbi:MAG: DUF445 domain-containing protein [Deltaproteobacteria bacterium]